MLAQRMVNNALDIAAYILEQRHKGKPVYVDWIDHPELKALVTKLVILPDDLATKELEAALDKKTKPHSYCTPSPTITH